MGMDQPDLAAAGAIFGIMLNVAILAGQSRQHCSGSLRAVLFDKILRLKHHAVLHRDAPAQGGDAVDIAFAARMQAASDMVGAIRATPIYKTSRASESFPRQLLSDLLLGRMTAHI